MSYTLNKTDGTPLITLLDGTADGPDINPGINSSDVNLFGKNYPAYGQYQNENFIKLLQNFASVTSPMNPLTGELWYDATVGHIKVFNGSKYQLLSPVISSSVAPLFPSLGDQWFDTVNEQTNIYNGTNWVIVGPGFSKLDGKSGALAETVYDISGGKHTVVKLYTNGNISAIVSYDQIFQPNVAISGFAVINPGITLSSINNNGLLYGTATNAQMLGNVTDINYARTDITESFNLDIAISSGNVGITGAGGAATLTNTVINGDVNIYNNISGVSTKTFAISGTNGLATVVGNPVTGLGVATKNYVDTNITSAIAPLATIASPTLTGAPKSVTSPAFDSTSNIATTSFVTVAGSLKANINSPAFTGIPTAPTPLSLDNSGNIATTSFVVTAISPLATIASPTLTGNPRSTTPDAADNSTRIATTEFTQTVVAATAALLATIASPTLTGVPKSVTPGSSDNSANIATTAFVQTVVSAAAALLAPIASPTLTGVPKSVTSPALDSTANIATTAFVTSAISTATAPLATTISPTLGGTPTAPTPASSDNSSQIATTAFTQSAIVASTSSLWQGSHKFVSSGSPDPGVGSVGDFWFQV